jgi:hypothetical protein
MTQPTDSTVGQVPADVPPQEQAFDRRGAAEAAPFVLLLSKDRAEMEQELLTDPCHLLRRACQIEDYGPASGTPPPAGDSGCTAATP